MKNVLLSIPDVLHIYKNNGFNDLFDPAGWVVKKIDYFEKKT
jgi:hypothetical protein